MVLIVAIGLYPRPLFDRISPAVRAIVANYPAETSDGPAAKVVRADASNRVIPSQDRAR